MTRVSPLLWLGPIGFGAGWGLMQPLNKIVVEDGLTPLTILGWQAVITVLVAGALVLGRGHRLPTTRDQWWVCAQIAVLGTMIPNLATYVAVGHLPAGLMAILLATIPIMALPIGVAMGRESAAPRRLLGLGLGMLAVTLIAVMGGKVAGGALWAIAVALIAPFCYALNAAILAQRGMAGMDPARAYLGAALIMLPLALALAIGTGQDIALFAPAQKAGSWGIIGIAVGHTLIYMGFLWLVGQAGAVFASQTAYFVTGFGVFWSVIILGERYPLAILVAGVLMLMGMMLVRPEARA